MLALGGLVVGRGGIGRRICLRCCLSGWRGGWCIRLVWMPGEGRGRGRRGGGGLVVVVGGRGVGEVVDGDREVGVVMRGMIRRRRIRGPRGRRRRRRGMPGGGDRVSGRGWRAGRRRDTWRGTGGITGGMRITAGDGGEEGGAAGRRGQGRRAGRVRAAARRTRARGSGRQAVVDHRVII